MELVIPDRFELAIQQGESVVEITAENEYTGSVTLPDTWQGKDWNAFPRKATGKEPLWFPQWLWAKGRVVEWNIDGLPSNPNQFKDKELPFHLLNFIVKEMHEAMSGYAVENQSGWHESGLLVMPKPNQLTAGEFLGYYQKSQEEGDSKADSIINAFRAYMPFIRQWPDGIARDDTGLEVDLSLIMAVVDRGNKILETAVSLGNSAAPLGGRFTKRNQITA